MNKFLVASVILFFLAASALASTGLKKEDLSIEQLKTLLEFKYQMHSIGELAKDGIITKEQADKQNELIMQKAILALGKPVNQAELKDLIANLTFSDITDKSGFIDKAKGWFNFWYIIATAGVICLVIGLGWLFALYIFPLLKDLPKELYELLVYLICAGLIFWGLNVTVNLGVFLGFMGCLGIIGGILFTHAVHEEKLERFYDSIKIGPNTLVPVVLIPIWGFVAMIYQSVLIGFITVMALEYFLGFSIIVSPLCTGIGFEDDDVIPRAMIGSVILLAIYSLVKVFNLQPGYFGVFSKGAFFMGTLVYFVGLIIVSSKWYHHKGSNYGWCQFLAIASALGALLIGNVFDIPEMRQVCGTLMFLWVLQKYIEIPFKKHFAWFIFGLGVLLFLSYTLVITKFPELFFFV